MRLTINDTATARLRMISGRLKDMKKFIESEAEQLTVMTKSAFDQGVEPSTGNAFAPNAPATVARKGSSKPLVDTGALRASVLSTEAGNSAIISFGVPYAGYNVFGTTKTPRRNPLPVTVTGYNSFAIPTAGIAGAFWASLPERLKRFLLERNGRR